MPIAVNGESKARALWIEKTRQASLRSAFIGAPGVGEARVVMLWSGISRGTERLVFEGRVPAGQAISMRAPFQEGEFSFPVKYGYCAVGRVEDGPAEWRGRTIFCLHPHQDCFIIPLDMARPVPSNVPSRRATLAANMETALNAVWDAAAGPGDRIAVIGAGVVGLLVASLCAALPGAEVTVVDTEAAREKMAASLGAKFITAADFAARGEDGFDLVFHASASAPGLAAALGCAGMEASVVEMSWYGDAAVAAPLGQAFHAKRLRLISSQVGRVSPSRRPRWSFARRLDKALELLADARYDALITREVAFEDAPRELPRILSAGAEGLATVLRY